MRSRKVREAMRTWNVAVRAGSGWLALCSVVCSFEAQAQFQYEERCRKLSQHKYAACEAAKHPTKEMRRKIVEACDAARENTLAWGLLNLSTKRFQEGAVSRSQDGRAESVNQNAAAALGAEEHASASDYARTHQAFATKMGEAQRAVRNLLQSVRITFENYEQAANVAKSQKDPAMKNLADCSTDLQNVSQFLLKMKTTADSEQEQAKGAVHQQP